MPNARKLNPRGALGPLTFFAGCALIGALGCLRQELAPDPPVDVIASAEDTAPTTRIAKLDESSFSDAQGYLLPTPDAVSNFVAWRRQEFPNDADMQQCLYQRYILDGGGALSAIETACNQSMASR